MELGQFELQGLDRQNAHQEPEQAHYSGRGLPTQVVRLSQV